jgi:hypothetical protein
MNYLIKKSTALLSMNLFSEDDLFIIAEYNDNQNQLSGSNSVRKFYTAGSYKPILFKFYHTENLKFLRFSLFSQAPINTKIKNISFESAKFSRIYVSNDVIDKFEFWNCQPVLGQNSVRIDSHEDVVRLTHIGKVVSRSEEIYYFILTISGLVLVAIALFFLNKEVFKKNITFLQIP